MLLQNLLVELEVVMAYTSIIFCGSISVKELTLNPVMHAKMKHVESDFHFLRELVGEGKLDVRYTPSHDQVEDILKSL